MCWIRFAFVGGGLSFVIEAIAMVVRLDDGGSIEWFYDLSFYFFSKDHREKYHFKFNWENEQYF